MSTLGLRDVAFLSSAAQGDDGGGGNEELTPCPYDYDAALEGEAPEGSIAFTLKAIDLNVAGVMAWAGGWPVMLCPAFVPLYLRLISVGDESRTSSILIEKDVTGNGTNFVELLTTTPCAWHASASSDGGTTLYALIESISVPAGTIIRVTPRNADGSGGYVDGSSSEITCSRGCYIP